MEKVDPLASRFEVEELITLENKEASTLFKEVVYELSSAKRCIRIVLYVAFIKVNRLHSHEIKIKNVPSVKSSKKSYTDVSIQNLDWRFVCKSCLNTIKDQYPESYSYGGTWKSRKVIY